VPIRMRGCACQSLAKGSRVVVVGRLQQRTWTAEDGSARQVVEVVAEELGPSLTGAPWWRHLSSVPANSRCRRAIASEPGLQEGRAQFARSDGPGRLERQQGDARASADQ
jgi:single-stranded DNA-binding protein